MERRNEWDEDSDEGPDPDDEMHNTEEAKIFEVRLSLSPSTLINACLQPSCTTAGQAKKALRHGLIIEEDAL
jgi:hypothetical protein